MTNSVDTVGLRRARTLWKALEIGAVVVAAVLWFTYSFLWTHYDSTRPRIPDPGAGRIYRLNTHGSIVYLTRGEEFLLNVLLLTSVSVLWRQSASTSLRSLFDDGSLIRGSVRQGVRISDSPTLRLLRLQRHPDRSRHPLRARSLVALPARDAVRHDAELGRERRLRQAGALPEPAELRA